MSSKVYQFAQRTDGYQKQTVFLPLYSGLSTDTNRRFSLPLPAETHAHQLELFFGWDFFFFFVVTPFPYHHTEDPLQQTSIQYPLHNDYRAVWSRFWRCWGILHFLPSKLAPISSPLDLNSNHLWNEPHILAVHGYERNITPVVLQLFLPILVMGQQVKISQLVLSQFFLTT